MAKLRLKTLKDKEAQVRRDRREDVMDSKREQREESAKAAIKRQVKALVAKLEDGLRAKSKELEYAPSDNERNISEICAVLAEILETERRKR